MNLNRVIAIKDKKAGEIARAFALALMNGASDTDLAKQIADISIYPNRFPVWARAYLDGFIAALYDSVYARHLEVVYEIRDNTYSFNRVSKHKDARLLPPQEINNAVYSWRWISNGRIYSKGYTPNPVTERPQD